MSNQSTTFNYLKLRGACIRSVEIQQGKVMNCVVIPIEWNDIFVPVPEQGAPTVASSRLSHFGVHENFRQKCINDHPNDPNYIPPSHNVQISYSEEFRNKAIDLTVKRVKEDAAFMAKNPSEEDIRKEAGYRVSNGSRVGYTYPMRKSTPSTYSSAAPIANTGAYTPPAMDASIPDDLPF